ncbi:MAG TPA: outer membrane beta-barrel protein [Chitinophagales bacterium]|nr:outer membrane beta-barrel protein [Chitinophagales bacterium]
MQKLYLFLLLTLPVFATAQHYKFELAAEAGPGVSCIYGSGAKQLQKQNPLVGYSAGLGLHFNTPKVVGIYTGVYVQRKGFEWPIPALASDGRAMTYRYQALYHYVTIPVMLNATVGKKVQFFVNAGGYVSALFRIYLQQKELGIDNVNPGGYQYVDAGFCGGMGLRVAVLKRLIISVEARNSTGFMKVVKNTEAKDAFYNTSTSFSVGLAYSFKPWKKKMRQPNSLIQVLRSHNIPDRTLR